MVAKTAVDVCCVVWAQIAEFWSYSAQLASALETPPQQPISACKHC